MWSYTTSESGLVHFHLWNLPFISFLVQMGASNKGYKIRDWYHTDLIDSLECSWDFYFSCNLVKSPRKCLYLCLFNEFMAKQGGEGGQRTSPEKRRRFLEKSNTLKTYATFKKELLWEVCVIALLFFTSFAFQRFHSL